MWVLIFIFLTDGEANSTVVDLPFVTMYECFEAREFLSEQVGLGNGYFKENSQAICIYTGEDTDV